MKMKTLIVCIIAALFSINIASAGIPMLVKAKITDKQSGTPMEVDILIKDSKGKKMKLKTTTTGEFQQVLTSGEEYEITFNSKDILRQTETFRTEDTDKYVEQKLDFKVNKIRVGAEIFDFDIFSPESATLNASSLAYMNKVKLMLRFNRSVKLVIKVNADDSYNKKGKKYAAKKQELVQQRVKALSDVIAKWGRLGDKISISTGTSGSSANDTKIEISEVVDAMNRRM